MWIYFTCSSCNKSVCISKSDPDISLLHLSMRCPVSDCDGSLAVDVDVPGATQLAAQELYGAVHGLGLPDERVCPPSRVEEVMVGKLIESVELEEVGGNRRTILRSLVVGGNRVFLGTGSKGPIVYRIATGE